MDKFFNKSREAELEPNQKNTFPEEISSTSNGQKKKSKNSDVAKIQQSYLLFRFTFTADAAKPISLFIVCGEKYAAVLWSQANLNAICKLEHQLLENKPADYFLRLIKHIEKQVTFMNKAVKINDKALKAIFQVAELVAGPDAVREVTKVHLSGNTISRRIDDMSVDIETIVLEKSQFGKHFSLQ